MQFIGVILANLILYFVVFFCVTSLFYEVKLFPEKLNLDYFSAAHYSSPFLNVGNPSQLINLQTNDNLKHTHWNITLETKEIQVVT